MKYTKEELSPTQIKLTVTVEADEADAAIDAAIAMQKEGINIAGYRKGHVPSGLIEKRFKAQIYADAANDLANVHINTILGELNIVPTSGITVDPTPIPLERGKETTYTVSFEHLPIFDLPNYEGLEVEQSRSNQVEEAAVDAMIERLRVSQQKLEPVGGEGPAVDGQYVNLDFKVLEGDTVLSSEAGVDLKIGQEGIFQPLDELVRSLRVNEEGTRECDFPEDFFQESLRGKHVTLYAKIYAIKEMKLPSDEQLVQNVKLNSMDEVRARAQEEIASQRNVLFRSEAQSKLVQMLVDQVEFPLPESMVNGNLESFVGREEDKARRLGKALSEEQKAEIRERNRAAAEAGVKSFIVLLAVAQKEGMSVTEQELQQAVGYEAYQLNQAGGKIDPQSLYKYYAESGRLYEIRDQILVRRASEAIYAKAKVTMVDAMPAAEEPAAEAAPAEEKAAE